MLRSLVWLNQEYVMRKKHEEVLLGYIVEFSCLGVHFVGREKSESAEYLLCVLGALYMLFNL